MSVLVRRYFNRCVLSFQEEYVIAVGQGSTNPLRHGSSANDRQQKARDGCVFIKFLAY
jgi:hypothetical protein